MKAEYWRAFALLREGLKVVLSFNVCFEQGEPWPSQPYTQLQSSIDTVTYSEEWCEARGTNKRKTKMRTLSLRPLRPTLNQR